MIDVHVKVELDKLYRNEEGSWGFIIWFHFNSGKKTMLVSPAIYINSEAAADAAIAFVNNMKGAVHHDD